MRVKILSNISWQSYPITDDMIEYDEELLNRIGIDKQFDSNGNIIDYVDNGKRIFELKQLLTDTDYKAIKYAEGEITAAEYEPIREQRRAWRVEINNLEKQLTVSE